MTGSEAAPGAGAELWLFGSGGHAKVVIGTARAAGWNVGGLIDPRPEVSGAHVLGVAVHGSGAAVPPHAHCLVAIGDSRVRQRIAGETEAAQWLTLVHPRADIAADATVGVGTVVMSMAVVQPGSQVGRHAIINTAAIVEHDNELADYAQLATGACLTGGVTVGTGSFIGAGAVVLPGITIGEWCTVGAGAVVTRDVRDGATVIGVPAREVEPLGTRT